MSDFVTWLRAQLDDDDRAARAASRPPWTLNHSSVMHSGPSTSLHPEGHRLGRTVVASVGAWDLGVPTAADADHIARWDPARVLAEVDAKRRMLDVVLAYEAKIDGEWGCCHGSTDIAAGRCPEIRPDEIHALRLLALPYADRPGYREEWRP